MLNLSRIRLWLFRYCLLLCITFTFSNSGFRIPKFVLGVIGVGVYHGAYISEVIRTGIEAIPRGQSEAAAPRLLLSGNHVLYHTPPDDPDHHAASGQPGVKPGEKHLYSCYGAGMDLMYFTDSWGSERKLLRTGLFYQRAFIFYHLFSAGTTCQISGDPFHAYAGA